MGTATLPHFGKPDEAGRERLTPPHREPAGYGL